MLFRLLLVLVLVLPLSVGAEISVEDFFKFPQADSLKLSPDGQYLAVRAEGEGKKEVYILKRSTKEVVQKFSFPQAYEAGAFYWLNNERLLVSQSIKYGALDLPASTGVYFAGNVDGSKNYQIWPPRAKAGATSSSLPKGFNVADLLPEQKDKILVQMYERGFPGIYEFDIYSSRFKKLETGPVKGGRLLLGSNDTALVSLGVDEDDTDLIKLYLKNSEGDWNLFETFNRKDGMLSPVQIYNQDKKMYVLSNTDGRPRGIYSFDLKTKELTSVFELSGDSEIDDYIYDFKYEEPELVGIEREPDYPVVEFFNKDSRAYKIQAMLEQSFPDKVVSVGSPTADNRFAVVRTYSDRDAGTFYLFDAKENKLSFEMKALPWIDEKTLSYRNPVSFTARDGLEIRGYLTLPPNKDKNLPAVVLVHGGPYGPKDTWRYHPESQFFASRGYAVLQINYRGSGGRGRDFIYDNYRKMGMEMQDDLTDGTLWAIEKGFFDKDRICIYGGSYGAYASLMGVIKEPDLYQCAIGYVGAYDIKAFKYSDIYERESGRKFLDEAWGYNDENFSYQRSPVNFVDKIKADVLIIHGEADRRTPIEHYESLSKAFKKAGKTFESIVKPHEGHGFYDMDNRIEIYSKMEAFLKEHIGH
ncbi:MAG: S9 family peptidase [Kangiella sp.]|jgi:dipeptidyl aminopeptidase/acylaminoacyl peptidase|nr:S9 family peptidase [Kangiella sp.]